jgi:hypothetical protein
MLCIPLHMNPRSHVQIQEVLHHHKENRMSVIACVNLEAINQFHQVYPAALVSDGVRRAEIESNAESRPGCARAERGRG